MPVKKILPQKLWGFSFVFIFLLLGAGLFFNFFVADSVAEKVKNSVEIGFTSLSPAGEEGGAIIPASCESGAGEGGAAHYPGDTTGSCPRPFCPAIWENGPCTATNACGQSAPGVICRFACNAVAPPLPTGYGTACNSAPNACGMTNSGTIQCNGSCSATTPSDALCAPPVPPPATPTNYTVTCNAAGDQATQSWDAMPGATDYYVRMNYLANDNPACTGSWLCSTPPDYANDNFVGTSITRNVIPGQNYASWVHSRNAGGTSAAATYNFTCTASTLKICQNSCSSGIQVTNGQTLAMQDTDPSRNYVACYSQAANCNDANPAANVTSSTTWSESGQNAITLSGTNPKTVTPNSLAVAGTQTEQVTATYSGSTSSFNAAVTKFCAVASCSTSATVCTGDAYSEPSPTDPSCPATACIGTRLCNFNWKEVAP